MRPLCLPRIVLWNISSPVPSHLHRLIESPATVLPRGKLFERCIKKQPDLPIVFHTRFLALHVSPSPLLLKHLDVKILERLAVTWLNSRMQMQLFARWSTYCCFIVHGPLTPSVSSTGLSQFHFIQ